MKAPNKGAKLSVPKKMLVMFVAGICSTLKRFTRYVVRFSANPNEAAFSNVSFAARQRDKPHVKNKVQILRAY